MPTGYTKFIEDGKITTGKEFILLCTRAFGIAAGLREEPLTVPTPMLFEPDDYYAKAYDRAIKRYNEFNMSFDDALRQMRKEYDARKSAAYRAIEKMCATNEKYKTIREEIVNWNPPTREFYNLKEFALNQIAISLEPESAISYYEAVLNEPFDDSEEAVRKYIESERKFLEDEVGRSRARLDEEIKNAQSKTRYMEDLMESLKEI